MKERKLKFNRNTDNTIVPFDMKKGNEIIKIFKNLNLALTTFNAQYIEGKLTESYKEILLKSSENSIREFTKLFDIEGILQKEKDEAFASLRECHLENNELRKQLGEKVSNEDFREKIKLVSKSVKEWWNEFGFGFMTEEKFSAYGVFEAKLSGRITSYRSGNNPKTKEDKTSYLQHYGFEITEHSGEQEIVDSDVNKSLLSQLLREKYPSCAIFKYECYAADDANKGTIKDIFILITNLDDISIII